MERNKTRNRLSEPRVVLPKPKQKQIQTFQKKIWKFYRAHKRSLPWRNTYDPYTILVSEIMLQQTQVDRVIPKYEAFLKAFPTASKLAKASTHDVLKLWSGLGYNSRALRLRRAAELILEEYKGKMPSEKEKLVALPGIGPYTAGAVRVFSFDLPDIFLETNIRTVLIHEFFPRKKIVTDKELLHLAEKILPKKDFRGWYSALMDYGSHLKSQGFSKNEKVKGYTKQSPLLGSNREVRGAILRLLVEKKMMTGKETQLVQAFSKERIQKAIESLVRENVIVKTKGRYLLVSM